MVAVEGGGTGGLRSIFIPATAVAALMHCVSSDVSDVMMGEVGGWRRYGGQRR